jgi:outer membrane protein TolC
MARAALGQFAAVALLTGLAWSTPAGRIAAQAPQGPRVARLAAPEPAGQPAFVPGLSPSTMPITLPAALQLANVRPIDIQLARQQLLIAAAQLERAEWLWLPTIYLGGDYARHDGTVQDVPGNIVGSNKSSLLFGAGPSMVFATTEAIFAPLAARQDARAREASVQATRNDTLLAVAEAYFNVQQSRGDLVGAQTAVKHAEELVRRADSLAPAIIPPGEAVRARAELSKREQAVSAARERWYVSSAELGRILRLETTVPVQPVEPPFLEISLVRLDIAVDDLIPIALTNRPELAARQALVQATLQRLREEKVRPLMPSVLLRGFSTPVTGTLGAGTFGGGVNDHMGNFAGRFDCDLQILWVWDNLGFGNYAKVKEKRAEFEAATWELFRVQDRIAAEVVEAYSQAQEASLRVGKAETGLKLAAESVQLNFAGLKAAGKVGDLVVLAVRPPEVLQSIQAFSQANADYYAAVADNNRAQFRLYRALGHPAQLMVEPSTACSRAP